MTQQGYTLFSGNAGNNMNASYIGSNVWKFTASGFSDNYLYISAQMATNVTFTLNINITNNGGRFIYYYNNVSSPVQFSLSQIISQWIFIESTTNNISITIPVNNYFGLALRNNDSGQTVQTVNFSNVPNTDGSCFGGNTIIKMENNEIKLLKDIKRGDIVLEDIYTNKTNVVARLYENFIVKTGYEIPKNLIGNCETLICTNHPIWCNGEKNRIFPSNIKGVNEIVISETLYDIQFEDEGTFYANNVKVDSLPPCNKWKLPKELYYNENKYSDYILDDEDDPIRNKPPMTNYSNDFVHVAE